MKSISIIGVGKLGLCFGLNLEKVGYRVDGCDINKKYLTELRNKTFISSEPGVKIRPSVYRRDKRKTNFFRGTKTNQTFSY